MEPGPMEYLSFFSPSFRDQIINLLLKIAKNFNLENSNNNKSIPSSSISFFSYIVNFVNMETSNSNNKTIQIESSKNKQYLESSIRNLSSIFEIPQQSLETIMSNEKSVTNSNDDVDLPSEGIYHHHQLLHSNNLYCYLFIFLRFKCL